MTSDDLPTMPPSSSTARILVERWIRRVDDVGIAQTLREISTPDLQLINPDRTDGIEGAIARLAEIEGAFPDAEFALQDVVAEGNRLVVVLDLEGTHLGALRDLPATGRRVRFSTAFLLSLRDGRIARMRMYPEFFSAMSQMGLLPPFEGDTPD